MDVIMMSVDNMNKDLLLNLLREGPLYVRQCWRIRKHSIDASSEHGVVFHPLQAHNGVSVVEECILPTRTVQSPIMHGDRCGFI
jgi:hypothetical protein